MTRICHYICIIIIFTASCKMREKPEHDRVVARVYDNYLYHSDIRDLVPEGAARHDSAAIVSNYIENWSLQYLILKKAESNISDQQEHIEKQVTDYRNALIIYAYQKELIRQKLDTAVNAAEIINYYDNNSNNFELKNNIVKCIYVKLKNSQLIKLNNVRNWLISDNEDDMVFLNEYCHQFAESFLLDEKNWISLDDILKELPAASYAEDDFLKQDKLIELKDSASIYMVRILDYKLKDDISPLAFEKNNIRKIILNDRKLNLIKQMEESVYQEAMSENGIKIY